MICIADMRGGCGRRGVKTHGGGLTTRRWTGQSFKEDFHIRLFLLSFVHSRCHVWGFLFEWWLIGSLCRPCVLIFSHDVISAQFGRSPIICKALGLIQYRVAPLMYRSTWRIAGCMTFNVPISLRNRRYIRCRTSLVHQCCNHKPSKYKGYSFIFYLLIN